MRREKDSVTTRNAFGQKLTELAQTDDKIVVIAADAVRSMGLNGMEQEYPQRVINVGIAEQSMMMTAAGLASVGYKAYATTFATFTCMRAMEEARTFVGYPHLNVKIVGGMGGLTGANEGVTHQGQEDTALMRTIPGMVVTVPADAHAIRAVLDTLNEYEGPAYIGIARSEAYQVYDESYRFEIGKGTLLREGRDVTIISNGSMLYRSLEAAEQLETEGISARVIDMACVKPIDRDIIITAARETGGIITAEDRTVIGGLGSAVCEVVSETCPAIVKRIGVQDVFGESGSQDELYDLYGLGVADIVQAAREIKNKRG